MTSAIVSSTINQNFPVAGQDNNSVGFRNNFTYIKTGLATAASEITALQNTTAQGVTFTTNQNDFNGNEIVNAETNLLYGKILTGNQSGNLTIEVPNAEYFSHTFTGVGNRTVSFTNWPAGGCSKIRVDLTDGGVVRTLTFLLPGGADIFVDNGLTYPVVTTGTAAKHYIFEVWTIDGGDNIFIKSLGTFEAI
jgi:hypothetical protein